jgi:hypothetical protein
VLDLLYILVVIVVLALDYLVIVRNQFIDPLLLTLVTYASLW